MAHSRGFRNQIRSPRRRTEWFAGVGSQAATALSGVGSTLLGNSIVTTFGEETLVRTRGLLSIVMKTAASVGEGFLGAVGIGIVSTAALTAGVASVPTPVTEVSWDGWLWHTFFALHESLGGGGEHVLQIPIDSKAMRKLETDMSFYAVVEVGVEIGTATADVFLDTRMLAKLP